MNSNYKYSMIMYAMMTTMLLFVVLSTLVSLHTNNKMNSNQEDNQNSQIIYDTPINNKIAATIVVEYEVIPIDDDNEDNIQSTPSYEDLVIEYIQSETNLPYESCKTLYSRVGNHEVLSVPIMLGIYWNESGFQPDVVNSSSNATGLAQFMPEYAEWLANYVGVEYKYEYLFDPTYSINLSVDLLEYYLDASNNDLDYALDHYSGFTPGRYPKRIRSLADGYQAKMLEYIELNQ